MMQGDIVLVMFPFSNLIDYKIRPALLVSGSKLASTEDKWFCPITSKPDNNFFQINNFLESGNLDRNSFVKTTAISTIDSSRILKKIGHVKETKMKEIIQSIINNLK